MPALRNEEHPSAFEPSMMLMNVCLSFLGAIIGLQIITTLGVTPNTSIIGVLIALIISRIPFSAFLKFRNIHRQNLAQTAISSATFGAANSLMLPVAIPFILGRVDLVWPMLIGATLGMSIDMCMLYWLFDSKAFPGKAAWPAGIAAAEAIKAGDKGGKQAMLLVWGILGGIVGSFFKIPMSALGITMIANMWAMLMFAIGLLLRGYSIAWFGIDLNAMYVPHGFMIGAGLVAGVQILMIFLRKHKTSDEDTQPADETPYTRDDNSVKVSIIRGFVLYILAGCILALLSGLYTEMSMGMLVFWIMFAAFACIMAEFIIGLSAMHSGWFPAFATTLIFLIIGTLLGFPPVALALLVGFVASGGPAFADGGFDFRSGWILRGMGKNPEFEVMGRYHQFISAFVGFGVGAITVALSHDMYFSQNLFPPVAKVFVTTIMAGVDPSIIRNLLLWAVPGAILQAVGGSSRQMGIMMSTGLLIVSPAAGLTVIAGLIVRLLVIKIKGEDAMIPVTVMAAGCIAGDALYGFFNSLLKVGLKK
ncbi:OPT/YSL family transporter [uncultured Mitsuokella sp.]|uniref:OPT/YSL family transporter n=1 Tax=uncultured Mitsuokella sp. TaxID=453120 RepID=UPI0026DC590A|nr:OPT/YSL family transporter [uncultured Mitsuokella sp.]